MALPAILAALGLTEAVWLAIMGTIRLIAWLGSIVYVASYVRDAVTKIKEADVAIEQNNCIESVLSRTDLTPEQKKQMAEQCISTETKPTDWGMFALGLVGLLGVAYVLGRK
jgi:hypothetical protein